MSRRSRRRGRPHTSVKTATNKSKLDVPGSFWLVGGLVVLALSLTSSWVLPVAAGGALLAANHIRKIL